MDDPEAAEGTTDTEETDAEDEKDNKTSKSNREAAKYRRRAQEAEEQLQATTAQLNQARVGLVEAHLKNISPKLFWQLVDGPEEFFTEDGAINPGKVQDQVKHVQKEFGLTRFTPDRATGQETPPSDRRPANVADAFRPQPK